MLIRIASRSSFLAKWQAYQVGRALAKAEPGTKIEFHFRESLGDKNQTDPLWKMPEKGVFTEDFYADLVADKVDMVVHSWKDLPTEAKEKSHIAATLDRADQRDLLLLKKTSVGKKNINIFSSSPRRAHHVAQTLKWTLPFETHEIHFADVRGNIQTRINKLIENEMVDGLIVAKAAIDRLMNSEFYKDPEFLLLQKKLLTQLSQFEMQFLPLSENPTAAAQGALAVEILNDRIDLTWILKKINNPLDFANCAFERKQLSLYGGGCHQKIGLSSLNISGQQVFLASGVTTAGKRIAYKGLVNPKKFTFLNEETMTSDQLWSKVSRKPEGPERELQNKAVLITKADALARIKLKDTFNYCSGVKSWKKIAALGIWVHGSLDSMGEDQLPETTGWIREVYKLSDRYWYKLTHQDSPARATPQPIVQIGSYSVEYTAKLTPPPPEVKMIYWKSGAEFLMAVKLWPSLLSIEHACGLGSTSKTIGSLVPQDKVTIYFDEADWRKCAVPTV